MADEWPEEVYFPFKSDPYEVLETKLRKELKTTRQALSDVAADKKMVWDNWQTQVRRVEIAKEALEGIRAWAKERWDDGIEVGTSGDMVLDNLSKTMLHVEDALADIKDGN